jgi:ligand-binding sensor domain-containing protein
MVKLPYMRNVFWSTVLLLAIGSTPTQADAQSKKGQYNSEYYFEVWGVNDGLSHPVIRNIVQDDQGYLWIATEGGLNKFDGKTFTNYYHHPTDNNSLSHNFLFGLDVDSAGVVWVGSEHGLNSFNPTLNQFTRYFHDENDNSSISDNYIRCVTVHSSGKVWVGTQNGINIYDPGQGSFLRLFDERVFNTALEQKNYSYNRINTIIEDVQGRMWVGIDGGGVALYSASGQKIEQYSFRALLDDRPATLDIVRSIFLQSDREVWIGTDLGVIILDPLSGKTQYLSSKSSGGSLINNYAWGITRDKSGSIWISTYRGGISVIDPESKRVLHEISYFKDLKGSISSPLLWPIYTDQDGGIWIGADGIGGLNYFHPVNRKFLQVKGLPP